jgi:hypothetical protein
MNKLESYLNYIQEITIPKPSSEEIETALKRAEQLHMIYYKVIADRHKPKRNVK